MRNAPLKGFQTCNDRKSPLRKFFTNPFTKHDKDDINAPMDVVEEVKEEKQLEDTTVNDDVPCYVKNSGMIPNKEKPRSYHG